MHVEQENSINSKDELEKKLAMYRTNLADYYEGKGILNKIEAKRIEAEILKIEAELKKME